MKLACYLGICLLTLSSLYGEEKKKNCDFIPIFYGTLLELPGTGNDPGEITFEPYLFGGYSYSEYTNDWSLSHTDQYGLLNPQLFVYIGITKALQIAIVLQSQTIFFNNHSTTNFSDAFTSLGFQFLWEERNTPKPTLRFIIGEVFPTGKYQNLGPTFNGNNSTGNGSYGTTAAFTLQKTFYSIPCHPFNININLSYTYYPKTNVHGVNTYGGGPHTHGSIFPGNPLLIAFAMEYCFTQKYLFALDIQYTHTFPAKFNGTLGLNPNGTAASIETASKDLFTFTPAIEFGITPTMCIYLGGYFTVAGRNTPASAEGNITFEVDF